MGEAIAKLWNVWRHGALLAVVYGLGLVLALVGVYLAVWVINLALGALGAGMPEERLFRFVMALAPAWVPFGLGYAARYKSSDKFKPEGYPEHI